jgi:hypothetical protein
VDRRVRVAAAVALVALAVAAVGSFVPPAPSPEETPDATFEIDGDPGADELVVEHAGGASVESGSLRVLVYEDRPVVPDRTVHGSVWESDTGYLQPGARIELSDPRFEPGQRVVVRWFGDAGQANLHEATLA